VPVTSGGFPSHVPACINIKGRETGEPSSRPFFMELCFTMRILEEVQDRIEDWLLDINRLRWDFYFRRCLFIETVMTQGLRPIWFWRRCEWHGDRGNRLKYVELEKAYLCETCETYFQRLRTAENLPRNWEIPPFFSERNAAISDATKQLMDFWRLCRHGYL